jgi:hypothetical protein
VIYKVTKTTYRTDYDGSDYATLNNDLGIVYLKATKESDIEAIEPVNLGDIYEAPEKFISGFGRNTTFNMLNQTNALPTSQMKTYQVQLVPVQECIDGILNGFGGQVLNVTKTDLLDFDKRILCTVSIDSSSSACFGDAGSALYSKVGGVYTLYGIVSQVFADSSGEVCYPGGRVTVVNLSEYGLIPRKIIRSFTRHNSNTTYQ